MPPKSSQTPKLMIKWASKPRNMISIRVHFNKRNILIMGGEEKIVKGQLCIIDVVIIKMDKVNELMDKAPGEEAVKTTLCLLDKSDLIILSEKAALMKNAISTLMLFEAVTTKMSAEKNVTGFKVIPLSRGLQRLTATSTSVLGVNLNNQIGNSFPLGMEENYLIAIPTLLDPRFKKAAFTDRSRVERMSRVLLNEVVALHQHPAPEADTGSVPSTADVETTCHGDASVWQFFDQKVEHIFSQQMPSTSAFMELDQYFKAPILSRQEDPLKWWKTINTFIPT
ncbi:PREDICTED: uncharacterized protein LOC105313656 [Amphimedon queenslandica]|uniref:HAT C-terminal dimerisation domain-containing protein n=2 Tax=Amphimedon queenslandica TaxID=400682 RepID=A0AAN0ING5_AMPQE|nr:PREDICTED: uncharacterized protein LOC105313656 [Amphimedon queenslandica]|eukprot:XP_011405554.1 PREDICTED: uncharacterized protein LOC105313656 [Amphimedon queenslandica]